MKAFKYFMMSIVACCGLLSLSMSVAVAAVDLYRAEVPVADQSEATRQAALSQALRQVLSKHSGLPVDHPEISSASLPDAGGLLQFVQYRTVRADDAQGAPWQQQRLEARFIPRRVDELVRDLRLPRWGDDRPVVMLALVEGSMNTGDTIHASGDNAAVSWARFLLADQAQQRGLEIQPLNSTDLQLPSAEIVNLINQGRPQALLSEADKEDTAILLGALREVSGRWFIDWALATADLEERFSGSGSSVTATVTASIDELVAILSEETTISVTDQGSWQETLVVESVVDGQAYQQLVKLFRDQRMVDSARLVRMDNERTEWQLQLNASPSLLESALEDVKWLQPAAAVGVYRYQPVTEGE